MQASRVEIPLGSGTLSIETGKLAKQAHGSAVVRFGDSMVLVAAVEGSAREGQDFFPLTVDYREKTYAAGKFPGGFLKREGRPNNKEILTSRLIDRPLRPLFPKFYFNEVQVMASTLSFDNENDTDMLSLIGASAALYLSPIPFSGPIGGVRLAQIDNEFVVLPTYAQIAQSDLDLVVAGTRDAVTMIEGFAHEMSEEKMVEAVVTAHQEIVKIIDGIENLRREAGLGDKEPQPPEEPNPLIDILRDRFYNDFRERKTTPGKLDRAQKVNELKEKIKTEFLPEEGGEYTPLQYSLAMEELESRVVRDLILEGKRIDGRGTKDLREIYCEVSLLPRTHGSAIFARGETQALVSTTLGTTSDEQRVDGLVDEYKKKFMLDYNFPPYSVGECKPIRGPGRREIGHGNLAERCLAPVIPGPDKFPYTVRVVSDILESNGSSSMASVCGGTLSLMDAGVPISDPVAGISIGLIKEPDKFTLLTDIMGDEDHFGDMDFKVAGTVRGITGIQLDLKIAGIDEEIIRATLDQAREARREILKSIVTTLRYPRSDISPRAPKLLIIRINPDKIGALIGPAGKNIKAIQESTGAKIDIAEDGTVSIAHANSAGAEAARAKVDGLTEEVQVGKTYEGRVTSIKDFGAFIEILPGRDGLCHISELDDKFVDRVDNVCKIGDIMRVKVIAIDDQDRVKLSRKALMRPDDGGDDSGRGDRGDRGGRGGRAPRDRDRDRGDRGGSRPG